MIQSVRVELGFGRSGAGDDSIRFEGAGHFPRSVVSEVEMVPALLGLPDDNRIPLGGCTWADAAGELDRALSGPKAPSELKLVDAGRLAARGPTGEVAFAPKHYPELTPYVSGVVYQPDAADVLPFEAGGQYSVSAEGGEAVGPFTAEVTAPLAFPEFEQATSRRGGDLDVRWSGSLEQGQPDPLLLTLLFRTRAEARELRCRVRDDGNFTISRELLAGSPPAGQIMGAEITLVRSHRAQVSAAGVQSGELTLSLRETASLAGLAPSR